MKTKKSILSIILAGAIFTVFATNAEAQINNAALKRVAAQAKEKEKEAAEAQSEKTQSSSGQQQQSTLTKEQFSNIIKDLKNANQAAKEKESPKTTSSSSSSSSSSTAKSSVDDKTAERHEMINKFFSLDVYQKRETAKALTSPLPKEEGMPSTILSNNVLYILKTKTVNVEEPRNSLFVGEDFSSIYPGAVVYCNQDLADGKPVLVPLEPGKVKITLNLASGGNSTRTVVPTYSNIHTELDKMLTSMWKQDIKPSIDLSQKAKGYSSVNKMAVKLGVNASFLGNKANVEMNTTSSSTNIISVVDFTQSYYTVRIDLPADRSSLFAPTVVAQDLSDLLKNGPYGIITSVTYGRRAYYFKEYNSKSFKFEGKESASVLGQKASSEQEISEDSEEKNRWVYLGGSDTESAGKIMKAENESEVISALANSLALKKGQMGIPISYTVTFLGTGKTCVVKTTGKYTEREYIPVPQRVHVDIDCNCSTACSDAVKVQFYYNTVTVDDQGNTHLVKVSSGQSDYDKYGGYRYYASTMHNGDKKSFDLPIPKGEYITGLVHVYIMGKTAAGQSHKDKLDGMMDPMDPNNPTPGNISFKINGSVLAGGSPYIYSKSYNNFVNAKH